MTSVQKYDLGSKYKRHPVYLALQSSKQMCIYLLDTPWLEFLPKLQIGKDLRAAWTHTCEAVKRCEEPKVLLIALATNQTHGTAKGTNVLTDGRGLCFLWPPQAQLQRSSASSNETSAVIVVAMCDNWLSSACCRAACHFAIVYERAQNLTPFNSHSYLYFVSCIFFSKITIHTVHTRD